MDELGDVVRDEDWDELADAEDRVVTEEFLALRRSWPLPTLPLKRWPSDGGEGAAESGYIEGGDVLTVHTPEGPVRARTYASIEQLLDAGWRVD